MYSPSASRASSTAIFNLLFASLMNYCSASSSIILRSNPEEDINIQSELLSVRLLGPTRGSFQQSAIDSNSWFFLLPCHLITLNYRHKSVGGIHGSKEYRAQTALQISVVDTRSLKQASVRWRSAENGQTGQSHSGRTRVPAAFELEACVCPLSHTDEGSSGETQRFGTIGSSRMNK